MNNFIMIWDKSELKPNGILFGRVVFLGSRPLIKIESSRTESKYFRDCAQCRRKLRGIIFVI